MPSNRFRFCRQCHVLFSIADGIAHTRCPAPGFNQHDDSASGIYSLSTKDEPSPAEEFQDGWYECEHCNGLFFTRTIDKNDQMQRRARGGRCPLSAGVQHERRLDSAEALETFVLPHNVTPAPGAQRNWRWCEKCSGLFFAGDDFWGHCPVGGEHGKLGNYRLTMG